MVSISPTDINYLRLSRVRQIETLNMNQSESCRTNFIHDEVSPTQVSIANKGDRMMEEKDLNGEKGFGVLDYDSFSAIC